MFLVDNSIKFIHITHAIIKYNFNRLKWQKLVVRIQTCLINEAYVKGGLTSVFL